LKEFFETFWDSGCARFGETGAVGWRNWMEQTATKSGNVEALGVCEGGPHLSDTESVVKGDGDDDVGVVSGIPLAGAWLKLEGHRMTHNCFPWQPDILHGQSEDDCTDPDRMVTFDDVSQTLFEITTPELKLQLLFSFLHFLGAPVESPFQSLPGVTTNMRSLGDIFPVPLLDNSIGDNSVPCGLDTPFPLSPALSLAEFADYLTKNILSEDSVTTPSVQTPAVYTFICNVCNHSISVLPSADHQTKVARVWLSFLFQQRLVGSQSYRSKKVMKADIRSIQKLFKSLLSLPQHRNNLSLWNSYFLFEYSVGNANEVKSLHQSLITQHPQPSVELSCSLCECFMGLRPTLWKEVCVDIDFALHTLVCLAEGKSCPVAARETGVVTPARILKARSHFSGVVGQTDVAGSNEVTASPSTMLCCAYFNYLTRGLKEACLVFGKWTDVLKHCIKSEQDKQKRQPFLSSLKVIYCKQLGLLEHHSRRHPVQPVVIRTAVQTALESFPNECKFMAALIRSERQTFISGRMRRYFDRVSPVATTATPWLLAVAAELDRYLHVTGCLASSGTAETSVGTLHRIRSLLDRAAMAENARHCVLLWRVYLALQVMV